MTALKRACPPWSWESVVDMFNFLQKPWDRLRNDVKQHQNTRQDTRDKALGIAAPAVWARGHILTSCVD